MNDTTRKVSDMYAKFPYPSSQPRRRRLTELANLLKIFCAETGYDLKGKSVLDAGTGTGHRLIEAAAAFPDTKFTAVDVSETPLAIARKTAANERISNVEFHLVDVMNHENTLGTFDVVLSMGVIHHLSDPAAGIRNLVRNLADDGIFFTYIYGLHGARERMRRTKIVSLLLNGEQSFERGIELVKDLGFDSFEYGWNLNFDDQESRDALIADAYLNVHETLFDVHGIFELMRPSGLDGFLVYGVSLEKSGALFDTRWPDGNAPALMPTDVSMHLPEEASEQYEALSLVRKYHLIDLLFQPNGYTLLGFKENARRHFHRSSRIEANALALQEI